MTTTMTSTQVINSIHSAFSLGDVPYIVSLVAQEAIWRQARTLPWGGDFRGPQGAAEFFEKLGASMETIAFEPRENIELGDDVFSFGSYTGRSRKTGRTAAAEWMFRWRVQGGMVVSYESYTDTAALLSTLD